MPCKATGVPDHWKHHPMPGDGNLEALRALLYPPSMPKYYESGFRNLNVCGASTPGA
jgi:hypothetical protein